MRPSIMSEGCDDVGAGLGMGDGLLDQHLDGGVVHHIAGVVDQPVLAVGREGVERDVGHDAELGHRVLERAHRALRRAVGIEGLARILDLADIGVTGNSAMAGMPSLAMVCASSTSRSMLRRSMPGIDGTARAHRCPRARTPGR
jgi:hypothetical protein